MKYCVNQMFLCPVSFGFTYADVHFKKNLTLTNQVINNIFYQARYAVDI